MYVCDGDIYDKLFLLKEIYEQIWLMVVVIMVFVHIEELYDIVGISIPNQNKSLYYFKVKINEFNLIG